MHIQFEIFYSIEILSSHIFFNRVLFDFWCAFNMLKMNFSENDFSSKSGIFCMNHRGEYVQKDIIVFKKNKNSTSLFGFSLFLFGFKYREF